jgi:phosphatidylserine decarboxylase
MSALVAHAQRACAFDLDKLIIEIECASRPTQELHPVIRDLQRLIESDTELLLGFQQMFSQVPNEPPFDRDPRNNPQVRVS